MSGKKDGWIEIHPAASKKQAHRLIAILIANFDPIAGNEKCFDIQKDGRKYLIRWNRGEALRYLKSKTVWIAIPEEMTIFVIAYLLGRQDERKAGKQKA